MSHQDLCICAQQLSHVWALQKVATRPACLHLAGLDRHGPFYQLCRQRFDGFAQYKWNVHEGGVESIFADKRYTTLVVLSDDDECEPLTTVGLLPLILN